MLLRGKEWPLTRQRCGRMTGRRYTCREWRERDREREREVGKRTEWETSVWNTTTQLLDILYMDMYMHTETISLTRGVCSYHSSQPRTWHLFPWPSLSVHHGKGSWNHSTQIPHQTRGREGRKEVGGRINEKGERGHVGCSTNMYI